MIAAYHTPYSIKQDYVRIVECTDVASLGWRKTVQLRLEKSGKIAQRSSASEFNEEEVVAREDE